MSFTWDNLESFRKFNDLFLCFISLTQGNKYLQTLRLQKSNKVINAEYYASIDAQLKNIHTSASELYKIFEKNKLLRNSERWAVDRPEDKEKLIDSLKKLFGEKYAENLKLAEKVVKLCQAYLPKLKEIEKHTKANQTNPAAKVSTGGTFAMKHDASTSNEKQQKRALDSPVFTSVVPKAS